MTPLNHLAARAINHVLGDYPMATRMLAEHASQVVALSFVAGQTADQLAPSAASALATLRLRIRNDGLFEPVGDGAPPSDNLLMEVPLSVLPRLARKDEEAFKEVSFNGDSELAHSLSTIAREVEWDIEADVGTLLGGGALAQAVTHRVAEGARTTRDHVREAGERLLDNVGEYLRYESNAFVSRDEFDPLTRELEDLRDAIARAGARLQQLQRQQSH